MSVDIARMIDHDAAAELWERYKRGERNVFTRRLYTMQGQQTFEEIRKRYRADREFKQTVDRYIGEFERLLEEVSQGERGQATARSYLTSDTGKVYTMLAHAAGRFEGNGRSASGRYRKGAGSAPFSFRARFWHRGAMAPTLTVRTERWPIAGAFTIARGAKTEAEVVVAELADGATTGRGECVPYARYGETVAGVAAAIEAMRGAVAGGLDRQALQAAMPAGAARNALDCAFWDFEAKRARQAGPCARRAGGAACRSPPPTRSRSGRRRRWLRRPARPRRASCSR